MHVLHPQSLLRRQPAPLRLGRISSGSLREQDEPSVRECNQEVRREGVTGEREGEKKDKGLGQQIHHQGQIYR